MYSSVIPTNFQTVLAIPPGFNTVDSWALQDRKPITPKTPTHKWQADDDILVPIFSYPQTKPARIHRKTKAQIKLRRLWKYSDHKHIVELTPGRWTTVVSDPDARLWWDKLLFTKDMIHKAWNSKGLYGACVDGKTFMGAADLDYNDDALEGSQDVFIKVFETIAIELRTFLCSEAATGWHYHIADWSAGGIHILWTMPQSHDADEMEATLKTRLATLDTKYPELLAEVIRTKAMKLKSFGQIEIFPNSHNCFRLCPYYGRDVITDRILVESKDRLVAYVDWLEDRDRTYADLDFVSQTLRSRLRNINTPGVSTKITLPTKKTVATSDKKAGVWRNNTARKIINFISGIDCQSTTLRELMLILARLSPYYFECTEDSVEWFETMIHELPLAARQSCGRLMNGDHKKVMNDYRRLLNGVSQPNPEKSEEIWDRCVDHWEEIKFNPFDPLTWHKAHPKYDLVIDWTADDLMDFAKLLTTKVVGRKKVDLGFMLTRIVEITQEKEKQENGIALGYWKKVMVDQIGIACGDKLVRRHQKIIQCAIELGVIAIHQRPCARLATRYTLGWRSKERMGMCNLTVDERMEAALRV